MKTEKPTTISEILAYYMHKYVEENCLDYDRQKYACRPLNQILGNFLPSQLNAESIKQYRECRSPNSDSTTRRELVVLISALNYCAGQLVITRDFPEISLPAGAPPKDFWLEEEELDAFWSLAETTNNGRMSRIFRFVAITSESASRKNAVQTLTWSQVDFVSGIIYFNKDGKKQKNKRRVAVPISDRLYPVLQRAYTERLTGCEYVLDTPYSIQHHWDDLKKKACGQLGDKFANITPHSLRHTTATLMAKKGVDLRQISGVLGASAATVERVYAHHHPDYLKKAINFRSEKP